MLNAYFVNNHFSRGHSYHQKIDVSIMQYQIVFQYQFFLYVILQSSRDLEL